MPQKLNNKKIDPKPAETNYYTKLLIYSGRRFSLGMICLSFTVVFASLIFNDLIHQRHWLAMALPLCLLGLILVVLPPTEEWDYQPWQTKKEQIERHFLD